MGDILAILGIVWGLIVTVLWLNIGWRAMVAHERMADAVERIAKKDKP
jgi:hypothetical protein